MPVRYAGVLGPFGGQGVDADDLTALVQVKKRREKRCRSPHCGAGFDDQVGLDLVDELLIYPEVGWQLPYRCAAPPNTAPGLVCVGEIMKLRHSLTPRRTQAVEFLTV